MTPTPLFAQTSGSGPALLFLHGLGGTSDVWQGILPLARRDWPGRIIAPDLRGHGRSPAASPYSFGTMAADVAALFEQNEEVTIVAHSMGAALTYLLATGLFGIRVRRMVCFAMNISWDPAEVEKIRGVDFHREVSHL